MMRRSETPPPCHSSLKGYGRAADAGEPKARCQAAPQAPAVGANHPGNRVDAPCAGHTALAADHVWRAGNWPFGRQAATPRCPVSAWRESIHASDRQRAAGETRREWADTGRADRYRLAAL